MLREKEAEYKIRSVCPKQTVSCYRCRKAFCPLLQTLLHKLPTEQSLSKPSHRKCEWGLFCHMQHHLKWHKTPLLHKTDHSIGEKKSQNKKSKNAVSLHNPPLLRHMKRDFYLANEV